MNHNRRLSLRAAVRIRDQLLRLSSQRPHVSLPDMRWTECHELIRRIERAESRGWQAAAGRLREQLQTALRIVRGHVDESLSCLDRSSSAVPALRDLCGDVEALADEFASVTFRPETLSVVTEPIVLDGIELGSFEICLCLKSLGQASPYRVIARDPHPAASDSSATHPHIQSEELCEGDGRRVIQSALVQGRLFDFFTLVGRILATYNPSSAYVSLSDWTGTPCVDCGRVVDDEDCYFCEPCGESYCSECTVICCGCSEIFCSQCIQGCDGCGDRFCRGCLDTCADCDEMFCRGCLTENETCAACQAAADEECGDDESDTNQAPKQNEAIPDRGSHAAVQPLCVGEAAVPP